MDSTTNVSNHDQYAVVARYVEEDKAREKLLRLVNACVLLKNPKSPQFIREVFRRSRSSTHSFEN